MKNKTFPHARWWLKKPQSKMNGGVFSKGKGE